MIGKPIPPREFVAGMVPASTLDKAMSLLRDAASATTPDGSVRIMGDEYEAATALARAGLLESAAPRRYRLADAAGSFAGGAL